MNRIVELGFGSRNPGWYSLQHVLFQASWGPLELQYLAVLAVLWAVLVLSLQRLVRLRYGRLAGVVALLVLVSAHGLAAVGYNHYLPQLLATTLVASTVLLLALPAEVALSRAARLAVAAMCIAFVGIAYYPMLPVAVVPVVLLAGLWHTRPLTSPTRAGWRKAALILAGVYVLVTAGALYAAQAEGMAGMLSALAGDWFLYLGKPRAYDLAWVGALLGGFSLQMLPPFSTSDPSDSTAVYLLPTAYLMLGLGLTFLVVRGWRRAGPPLRTDVRVLWRSLSDESRFRAAIAAAVVLFVSIEVVLGRRYEYTQFKALSYALPLTLLAGIFAASWLVRDSSRPLRAVAAIAVVLLIVSLAFFRVDAATRIAKGRDRTGVLSLDVPALAREIRADHPDAFFLAVPSHADEYPLWDLGLRDGRTLIVRFYKYPAETWSYVRAADLPDLWILEDAANAERYPGTVRRGTATAYRVAAAPRCRVLAAVLHEEAVQTVAFAPLGAATEMRYHSDVDYWIFGATHASTVEVLVKEHEALRGRRVAIQLLFPVTRNAPLPAAKVEQQDALAVSPTNELPRSGLVVIRVPGTGYSDVRCR